MIQLTVILLLAGIASSAAFAAEVFLYSTQTSIRGLDLDKGTDRFLTNPPFTAGVNSLAYNLQAGIVYYGDQTSVYRWDPALGSGVAAHALMNDFSVGPLTADITNINSTAGSFVDGKYYVGSESDTGFIKDIYELTMSTDGTQVVSVRPLNLLDACACTEQQIGGFGDTAAVLEGGEPVLFGSSADLSGNGQGTLAGRWRFTPSSGNFQLLAAGTGGQMSGSPSGRIYSNAGTAVREVDRNTGLLIGPTLINTSAAIFDFSGGFAIDFGDAPDSYGSAFHRLNQLSSAHIGLLPPDNEAGSLNIIAAGANGTGDDTDGDDDEDAVSDTLTLSSNDASFSLAVQCSPGARVSGWIDTNINGVFDTNERNANHPVTCSAGQANLVWSGLLSASAGNTFLRLRASTNASAVSRPIGVASDGEVEDHPVTITGGGLASGSCPAGSTSHVFSANDLPLGIGPNFGGRTISTIPVAETGTIVDVNVLEISGTHTSINDLIFLMAHGGTTRRLYGQSCGRQNNFAFGFDDAASGTPPCAPIDGNSYPPVQSLDAFNGQSISGNWLLGVFDRRNRNGGALDTWRLELCTSGGAIVETPDLIIGKSTSVSGSQVTVVLSLINAGNVALNGLSVTDNLDSVFGVNSYSITTPATFLTAPAGFVINGAFDGAVENEFIGSSTQLLPGEKIDIQFTVNVDTIATTSTPGQYANQAEATGISTSGTAVTDLSGNGLDLSTDTDDVTAFTIDTSATLSGFVFEDTSINSDTSHDGAMQSTETGVSDRVVRAIDASGTVLFSTLTDANGFWQLSVSDEFLNQSIQIAIQQDTSSRFVSEASLYTVGSVSDGIVNVLPGFGQDVDQINVGVVLLPAFIQDHNASVLSGSSIEYPHRFTASTYGRLDVSIVQSSSPVSAGWTTSVYVDANCNELLDPAEVLWSGSVVLDKDEVLCMLVVESVPSTATGGTVGSTSVNVRFSVTDESGTGHGVEIELLNQDVTAVVRPGVGRLELTKTVSNITLGGVELLANRALPGHILEYIINYRNVGDGALTELSIDDAAPAFTQVLGASVVCGATPVSLTCTPSLSGASVSWAFSGSMAAGQLGTVSYQVVID